MTQTRISLADLQELCAAAFSAAGVPPDRATAAAGPIVEAEARGIESHGVRMVPGYVSRLRHGGFTPAADPHVVREGPAVALLDGENALGTLVATRAMTVAIAKAKHAGIGACAALRSNHYGAAACYALQACRSPKAGPSTPRAAPPPTPKLA